MRARILVLNLQEQEGETEGLSPTDHLEVLSAHAPDLGLDAVVADTSLVGHRVAALPQWLASSVRGSYGRCRDRPGIGSARSADDLPKLSARS